MNTHYKIEKYTPKHYRLWNDFVAGAKNATFLFHRDFMEYHGDRFEDFSLLVFKNGDLISVFPANIAGQNLHSHQGLSYGGFVFDHKIRFKDCLETVKHTLQYCVEHQIKSMHLKLIPKIYHRTPADEIDYILFLLGAKLTRRDLSSSVLIAKHHFSRDRRQGIKRGQKNKLRIAEESGFTAFWNELLIPRLQHKHHKNPVHSLEEIRYLKAKFPEKIRQFNVYNGDKIVAGTTVFESAQVAHSQYTASNADKNSLGSLDLLHHHFITEVFNAKTYFDFGISNEKEGKHLNEGLLYWKQGYGNASVVHDFYEIDPGTYLCLNPVFI